MNRLKPKLCGSCSLTLARTVYTSETSDRRATDGDEVVASRELCADVGKVTIAQARKISDGDHCNNQLHINFYYSTTLTSVYVSSARRAIFIITIIIAREILALYPKCNDLRRSEMQTFPGGACPQTPLVAVLCVHFSTQRIPGTPPLETFCLRPC